ncbi:MAG: cytochrome c [Quisquiliibacterium sp.]
MRKFLMAGATALVFLSILAPLSAKAQFAKLEDAVKYRQSAFALMGNHLGRLAAMAKGTVAFDAAAARQSALLIQVVSKLPWEGFVPGSDGGNAKLKADPWKQADEFAEFKSKMLEEADKLPAAAITLESLKAQVGATGKACTSCHKKFRKL